MDGSTVIADGVSLDAGLAILADASSAEARVIDAMDLLATYYSYAEDQVIPALKDQLLNGKTSKIRGEAAEDLMMPMPSRGAMAALDEARPLLDEKARDEVEFIDRLPGRKNVLKHMRSDTRTQDDHLAWSEARMDKVLSSVAKWAEKMCERLLKNDLDLRELLSHPHPVTDIAFGGIGYRIDLVPKREASASISIWLGSHATRCAVGPRSAILTTRYITGLGRKRSAVSVRSAVEGVRQGRVKELIAPDGSESLVLVDLGAGVVEPFKSSSTVPDEQDVPADWVAKTYEPY